MKVAIITNFFYPVKGGIENHCYNLAKQLLKRGINLKIHTSTNTLTEKNSLKKFEIVDDIKVFRHKKFKIFTAENSDIIHLQNFNVFPHLWIFVKLLLLRLIKLRRPKLIITLHGGFTPWWEEFCFIIALFKKIYHCTFGKFFLNYIVDFIITVSEWERQQLISNGIQQKKIGVIPNGVDDLAYVLPPQKDKLLEQYKPYFLFLGRIAKVKNIDFIIKNLKDIGDFNLLIAGPSCDIKYYDYLKNLVKNLNLNHRVIFYKEVTGVEKYSLIDNSLAVILPSFSETEPIAIKEAMARGKPALVSRKTVLPYLVKHYINGFVFSTKEEFENAVKLLRSEKFLEKIEISNQKVAENWRWDLVAGKTCDIYLGNLQDDCL